MRRRALAAAALTLLLIAGCGQDREADEAAIRDVLVENEVGGPERCSNIYTDAYLEENWNEDVTAYGDGTPLEKCEADTPYEGVTEDDVEVTIRSLEEDNAVATSKVRAEFDVAFTLIRGDEGWQIDGFAD